jgi:hypothetical protein
VTNPLNFTKFNFDTELHFTYFSVLLWLKEREKVSIGEEFSHQNNCFFNVKWFHMTMRVKITFCLP